MNIDEEIERRHWNDSLWLECVVESTVKPLYNGHLGDREVSSVERWLLWEVWVIIMDLASEYFLTDSKQYSTG